MAIQQLRFVVEGMHCGGCVTRVTNALRGIDGVEVHNVEVGSARVSFDDEKADSKAILSAVNKIGFTAREA